MSLAAAMDGFARLLYTALAALGLALAPTVQAAQPPRYLTLEDGTEIPYTVFGAPGKMLLLWLPSEAGLQPGEIDAARRLAKTGNEVWLADLLEGRFLPTAESSLDRIPGGDVAALVRHAHRQTGKTVFLVANGRGAVPALRGAREWQLGEPGGKALGGVVLLSPKFFVETPDPGTPAQLLPIVRATNLPVFILQPDQSPWRWRLNETVPALEQGGSPVFVWRLKDARDRFYFRPDATEAEQRLAARLPGLVGQAARLLAGVQAAPRQAAASVEAAPQSREGKKARELKPYQGDPGPPTLRLRDREGSWHDLADYKGRVVLVNFWASWCPPCVHEMPSMQRLKARLKDRPFTILAVNMAEDEEAIRRFLAEKVKVDFTILMDRDGAALKRWDVFAFPTSFVIDRSGRIRYALFGAVEWDSPEILAKIGPLLEERIPETPP